MNAAKLLRSRRVWRVAVPFATGAVIMATIAITRPDPCVDAHYKVLAGTVYSKVPDRARYAAEALCKSPANLRETKPWLIAARHEYASKVPPER